MFPLSLISDVGFEIPNRFVVGYALDYNEYFRDLNVSEQYFSLITIKDVVDLTHDLHCSSFFFLAYLCDQRKWEEEI